MPGTPPSDIARPESRDLIPVVARRRAENSPRTVAFEYFSGETWRPVTSAEHVRLVDELAAGLIDAGVQPGDRVALMCSTRYEWVMVDMAVWTAGAITVPVYPSSSAAQIEWILRDSGAVVLIAEDEGHEAVVAGAQVPETCREVLYIDHGDLDALRGRGHDLDDEVVDRALATLTPETPASIVYTSGTTGRPKGCVITHANLLAECSGLLEHPVGAAGRPGGTMLMFLPLAHVLARAVTYVFFLGGGTTGFWGDTSTLVERLADFRPHLVLGVPRVFEKLRDGVSAHAHSSGRVQGALFDRAETVAIAHSKRLGGSGAGDARDASLLQTAEYTVADALVFKAVRKALGGRCEYAISGGGALPDRVAHFFRGVGVPIYEGYGLTETTAAIAVNGPGCARIGTVGRPIADNAVEITSEGEVRVSGPVVFTRYWNDEEATAAALTDGWFATGDLGSVDDDGYLRITGRKKEIIVTAGGKNVAPGPLEDVLRAHKLIGNAMVVGEGRRYVAALIAVDEKELRDWAVTAGLGELSLSRLCEDPSVQAEVQYAVDEANATVSHAEGIKRFVLLPRDFSEAEGELTATLKLKRHVIADKYQREIEELYR